MKRWEVFGVTSPSNEPRSCCSLCSRYNLAIRIVGVSKESMRTNARTAGPTRLLFRRGGMALFFVVTAFLPTLLLQRFFPYPFLFLFFGAVMASAHRRCKAVTNSVIKSEPLRHRDPVQQLQRGN